MSLNFLLLMCTPRPRLLQQSTSGLTRLSPSLPPLSRLSPSLRSPVFVNPEVRPPMTYSLLILSKISLILSRMSIENKSRSLCRLPPAHTNPPAAPPLISRSLAQSNTASPYSLRLNLPHPTPYASISLTLLPTPQPPSPYAPRLNHQPQLVFEAVKPSNPPTPSRKHQALAAPR